MKRFSRTAILCIFCFFASLSPGLAQKTYLFVGTYFPFIFERDKNGAFHGISVDILKHVSELTGYQFELQLVPWPRAISMVKKGTAAGLIGPYKTPQRETFMHFTKSHYYEDRMVFVKRKNATIVWNGDFNQLGRQSILTIKNWAYGTVFKEYQNKLNTQETIIPQNAIKMLEKGRVDLLAFNERSALDEMRDQQLEGKLAVAEPHFSVSRGYFGLSKTGADQTFLRKFNEALNHLYETGEIKKTNARYGLSFHNE